MFLSINQQWSPQLLRGQTGGYCGDGQCDSDESATWCPSDCSSTAVCGNGYCEFGETYGNCFSDCWSGCGNGLIENPEQCDDGNLLSLDGCSAFCTSEAGFSCLGQPSSCRPVCGDGIRIPPEQCDDGNTIDGDDCSSVCETEFAAAQEESSSSSASVGFSDISFCGNGLIDPGEQCDDGNLFDGDGCDHLCVSEILAVSSSSVSSAASASSAVSSSSSVILLPSPAMEQSAGFPWWMVMIAVIVLLLSVILYQWFNGRRSQEG